MSNRFVGNRLNLIWLGFGMRLRLAFCTLVMVLRIRLVYRGALPCSVDPLTLRALNVLRRRVAIERPGAFELGRREVSVVA